MNKDFLQSCYNWCSAWYYPIPVKIIQNFDLTFLNVKSRINHFTHKKQYLTTDILYNAKKYLPEDAYCMICILTDDLYPEESWNFVFGEADDNGRIGVFSFARYNPLFFGEKAFPDFEKLVLYRACSVMVHEIGHMFGLEHCIFYSCVMNGANNLKESDNAPIYECPVCMRKLHHVIGFDPLERYKKLAEISKNLGGYFKEPAEFYQKRIKKIY